MTDRPILFSAPMVRALLAGTKTQTRRPLNPQPQEDIGIHLAERPLRFAAGDRLYVRETHARHSAGGAVIDTIFYRATPDRTAFLKQVMPYRWSYDIKHAPYEGKWRPGIHMPRWASRLTLDVTEVRVQRLQDCSEVDALAEGVSSLDMPVAGAVGESGKPPLGLLPSQRYAKLWDDINGAGAWEANPWVVAISFNVKHGNIDAMKEFA